MPNRRTGDRRSLRRSAWRRADGNPRLSKLQIGHLFVVRYLPLVKPLGRQTIIAAIGCGLATAAPLTSDAATTPRSGVSFNGRGKVVLHPGEPCTSQIMFDFHPLNSRAIIWMAAGAHDSAKLTEAAGAHRRLRIAGVWRRGQHAGCAYVEVTKFIAERSWLESLSKR